MNTTIAPPSRRSDLDALRAGAMLLGILLHAALSFIPAGWVVTDSRTSPSFGILISAIHGFRMPLFFVLSGYFSAMLLRQRGLRSLLKHRFRRVLLPLLLGLVTIVPAMSWVSAWAMSSASPEIEDPLPPGVASTLWAAAEAGDLVEIERHLKAGTSVDQPDPQLRLTPLHHAAISNQPEAAQLLLDHGADPDPTATDGGTPLHAAAFLGNENVVTVLVAQGANLNARNRQGQTPLDTAIVDVPTTIRYASMLDLPIVEDGLGNRKTSISNYLREQGATAGPQPSPATLLMQFPLLNHLWFLWFLWLLVLGLAIVHPLLRLLPTHRLPSWLFVSPARYLWLIPLTMLPQSFMGSGSEGPLFGPDTSAGLLPIPHVLAYYAIFFGFGAAFFGHEDTASPSSGRWWLPLTIALLTVFPLGMALSVGWPASLAARLGTLDPQVRRLLSVALQSAYPWLLTFGLMGMFRRFFPAENPTMRYLSDSAYWLYLAHLPLVIAAQSVVRDWPIPAIAKLVLIVVVVTSFLLLTYQFLVRYTWLGRLLNGARSRTPALSRWPSPPDGPPSGGIHSGCPPDVIGPPPAP
jgi:hypothetical protein